MKKVVLGIVAAMLIPTMGEKYVSAKSGEEFIQMTLTNIMEPEDTGMHSMHQGILAEYPCETVDTLELKEDGTYILNKDLHSVKNDEGIEISCVYSFEGTYTLEKTIKLVYTVQKNVNLMKIMEN